MTNGSVVTNDGKNTMLYRMWTPNASLSAIQYLAPSKFKVSIATTDPAETNTSTTLGTVIPILNGTILDDGTHNFTGVFGGANTTDNAVTYKEGGGVSDNTAQDLNTNTSSRSKVWQYTMAGGATATQYCGFWLYIKDAATLVKFNTLTSIYSITIELSDGGGNGYILYIATSTLAVGWNWLSLGIINSWTVEGTPATLDRLSLTITTNYASDTFAAGDVIFDLLRTWVAADTVNTFALGYPSFNFTDMTVQVDCTLNITKANGFLIDGCGVFNEDTINPLLTDKAKFTAESKSSGDEIIISFVNRIR